ncbi:MAG: hypothetical protein JO083_10230 [Candidatus Eremiobacteraeota bacterium]|nr:hypothetical protein [Candidatus Eremiobacteraeota bacterium]
MTPLAISAIFPFTDALMGIVRARRFDPIVVLSLLAIVIVIGTSGMSGNPALAVAKESLFTGVFGVVFLGSLRARRPMIFTLGKQFSTGGDPAAIAAWDARWENPGFRRVVRQLTAAWGGAFLLEAFARVIVAFTLPVAVSTVVSPVLGVTVILGLVVWTTAYIRAVRRRLATAAATPELFTGAGSAPIDQQRLPYAARVRPDLKAMAWCGAKILSLTVSFRRGNHLVRRRQRNRRREYQPYLLR